MTLGMRVVVVIGWHWDGVINVHRPLEATGWASLSSPHNADEHCQWWGVAYLSLLSALLEHDIGLRKKFGVFVVICNHNKHSKLFWSWTSSQCACKMTTVMMPQHCQWRVSTSSLHCSSTTITITPSDYDHDVVATTPSTTNSTAGMHSLTTSPQPTTDDANHYPSDSDNHTTTPPQQQWWWWPPPAPALSTTTTTSSSIVQQWQQGQWWPPPPAPPFPVSSMTTTTTMMTTMHQLLKHCLTMAPLPSPALSMTTTATFTSAPVVINIRYVYHHHGVSTNKWHNNPLCQWSDHHLL